MVRRLPMGKREGPRCYGLPLVGGGCRVFFHLTAVWRKRSPGEPDKIEALLPKQIKLTAEWLYWKKAHVHDVMFGKWWALLRFLHPTRPQWDFRERDTQKSFPDLLPIGRTLHPPTTQCGTESPWKFWLTRTCESDHTGRSC